MKRQTPPIRHLVKPALGLLAFAPLATLAAETKTDSLPEVRVTEQRDADRSNSGYYGGGVTNVGRTPQQQRDIPQSTVTVTQQLIKDQGDKTVKDALRNVSGLTFNAGEGGRTGDNLTLRGFAAYSDLYVDGLRDIGQYNRDLFFVDQVEVLRGPASMLFGRGSTGGVINQTAKEAFLGWKTEASATVGTDSYYRATMDWNHKLSDHNALRINAMATDAGSFREGAEQKRWGFAPTVTFGLRTNTQITASWVYMKEDNVPDYGVPYYNGRPIDRWDTFYGLSDADYEKTDTHIGTLRIQHKFSPDLQLKNTLRYGSYEREVWPTAPRLNLASTGGVLTDQTVITRGRPGRQGDDTVWSNQTDLLFNFTTGAVKHQVLSALELGREDSWTSRWTGPTIPNATVGNPNNRPVLPAMVRIPGSETDFTADTVSLMLQDTMTLAPQWKLVAGLRWDRFEGEYRRKLWDARGNLTRDDYSRTDRVWSGRSGLLYQPDQKQSYYLSWGTSFNPSGEAYALDPRGANTPPEKNRNIEIGAKLDLLDGDLALHGALYRTEKTNERNTDPLIPDVYLLSGKRHTDGIEIEVAGRITEDWLVYSSVALMRGRIDRALDPAQQGKRSINTPRYTASLWTDYRIGHGWKVGGGVNAVGKRYTSLANTTNIPAYTVWNAMAAYETRNWDIQLNLNNIGDERAFENLYGGHAVPGAGRSAQLMGTYRF
ncbi:TonB-dependent receptor [Chitinimonas lacunae]|uniref:TonB-dependent receptor n=1 Tax=Chitinimonas lacunae TaxID=1963018 RepID=A0ABV8MUN1_9NEIS